jgi:integrase
MSGGNGTSEAISHHRLQKGQLSKRFKAWHVRYYGWSVGPDGARVWREKSKVLGRTNEYPKRSDIEPVFREFMDEINFIQHDQTANMATFVEKVYLPSDAVMSLAESTRSEYQGLWNRYLKNAVGGETLASFRPVAAAHLLQSLVKEHDLSKHTSAHVKAFLSGVFTFARNQGYFDGANPITGVKLPRTKSRPETYAYDLQEERAIMDLLELMPRAAIAVASWAGFSRGEIQGLRWEDRRPDVLHVRRSVWQGIAKGPKNTFRQDQVPVISSLREVLDEYWQSIGRPEEGWMFAASRGSKSMDLNNLYRRHIMEPLRAAGLTWYGWHAFRRGLASNLSELGIPDHVIQQILRHADVQTTARFYRKTRRPAVTQAMKKLDRSLKREKNGRTLRTVYVSH